MTVRWPFEPCRCIAECGDSDPDGPGVCKGLPRMPEPPLVEIVLVHRDDARAAGGATAQEDTRA